MTNIGAYDALHDDWFYGYIYELSLLIYMSNF